MHTHDELCRLAVKWLKRNNAQNGHGCTVAASEAPSGSRGEIPDAIGFRINGWADGSVVVEVKTSRSDFLADRKKAHRAEGQGLGNWRYFMCPTDLIKPDELPEKWGLLYVNARGHVKPIAGPAAHMQDGHDKMSAALNAHRLDTDLRREHWLLVRLLSRVSDPEQVNRWLRESRGEAAVAMKQASVLKERNEKLVSENWRLGLKLRSLEKEAQPNQ